MSTQNYDEIRDYKNGLAAVRKGPYWGFIDVKGNEVVPPKYLDVRDFCEGFAAVSRLPDFSPAEREFMLQLQKVGGSVSAKRQSKWGFIDTLGREVIPVKYDGAQDFCDGWGKVKVLMWKNINSKGYDKQGHIVSTCEEQDEARRKFIEASKVYKSQPKNGPCFVATAVYQDFNAYEVKVLRKFRDKHLLGSIIGRLLVSIYYEVGPYLAKIVSKNYLCHRIAKGILDHIVYRIDGRIK